MTSKAALADLLRGDTMEGEDFGFVAAGVDVGFTGTVTALATFPCRAAIGPSGSEVWILCVSLSLSVVTGSASFRSRIQRGIRRWNIGLTLFRGFLPATGA